MIANDQPLVSIITPYLDAARFIPVYVQMLRSQSYTNYRVYLIDDGSIDESTELLRLYTSNDSRFLILSRPGIKNSQGPSDARNYGLSVCTSSLISFCDIDDYWSPSKLAVQVSYHLTNNLDISVTAYRRLHHHNQASSIRVPPKTLSYHQLLISNPIPLSTVLISTSLHNLSFPFTPHEDYAMWLNIFASNPNLRYGCIRESHCVYQVHDGNLSRFKLKVPFWILRVYLHHTASLPTSILLTFRWCFHSVLSRISLIRLFT